MSLLVTGSIGIDTVETPSGKVSDVLGGSCVYFAAAASFFSPVRLVGVVGEDCPKNFLSPLKKLGDIDLEGVEVRKGSKTFRWHGRYHHDDVNCRDTIGVELNVLAERGPTIPQKFRDSTYAFLANTHPGLQLELLSQLSSHKLVVADTMDLWINNERPLLVKLLEKIDGLVMNDSEAKLLTCKSNVITAGFETLKMVKRFVVIKKGEHGSLLFAQNRVWVLPGYPTSKVVDPTGAGDSFAGAMMGYLASADASDVAALRKAIAYGTVTASMELEDFSLNKFMSMSRKDIDSRLAELGEMTAF